MLLIILTSGALLLVILNSLTMRVVKNRSTKVENFVSILIPMRNEEVNVSACLNSVINQKGLTSYEVIALDDGSDDQTMMRIKSFPTVQALTGDALPPNWLGKLWACQQLANASKGEYLVFIDADVRVEKNAIASAISQMKNWDYMSVYPRQVASGFIARVFQPLLQWSWLASVPLIISQRLALKSMVVANGQFFIIKRDAYFKSGGHESVSREVLDDLKLAKQLLAKGFKGGVAEGSQVSQCQMYQSGKDLIKGYQKSLWSAFGSPLGSVVAVIILFISGVLPFLFALAGSEDGLIAFTFLVLSRVIASVRTGSLPNTALFHPLAIAMLILLIIYSWYGHLTKTNTWRDRMVA